jgi:leader peptidase (prepilin peptidase)/N-methyltransferase
MSRIRNQEIDEIALGFGDVNLSGVIGLLLGWPGVLAGLVGAIILGGVVSGLYLAWQAVNKRYEAFSALPYGPFLALSALFLLFIAGNI